MMENRFYKVDESGFGTNTVTMWNPVTNETTRTLVWDIDDPYYDSIKDLQELRFMTIDKEVRKAWLRSLGVISEGDFVKVIKGRKMAKGYTGIVQKIQDWYDCYGRPQCTYVYFEDGQRTAISNCELV